MLGCNQDRSSTYGSNSWMTLSNLKTEKSLVENAEEKEKHTMDQCITVVLVLGWQYCYEVEDSQRTAAIDRMSSFSNVSCFS